MEFLMQNVATDWQNMNYITVTKNTTVQLQSDCDWNCTTKELKIICTVRLMEVCYCT